jgi:ATP-binding cassette, subfamily B, multidrug efflux pump
MKEANRMIAEKQANLTPRQFIFTYLARHRNQVLLGFGFVVMTNIWQVATPWVLRYGIEYLEYKTGHSAAVQLPVWLLRNTDTLSIPHFLILLSVALTIVAAIQGVFRYLMRTLLIGLSREIEYEIRNDYLEHLQTLPASFYQRYKTGDLMARATNDIEAIRTMLGPGIMYAMNAVTVTLFSFVLMMSISPSVTLWSMLPMPFVAIIVKQQVAKINRLFQNIQAQYATMTAKVQENLSGIRVIKSYVQEPHEIADFAAMNREYIQRNMKLVTVRAGLWSSIEFLLGLTVLSALFFSGRQVIGQQLSIGALVAFIAYIGMLAWPVIAMGWVLNLWQEGLASSERVLNLFKEKSDIQDGPETDHAITELQGQIQFDRLSFHYDSSTAAVLKNISLTIPRGATLAIVGHTGSGKSTLVNLIPRLYNAPAGSVLIDGHDIRRIPLLTLRRHIGFVSQEAMLFSDTLSENLAFGVEQVSDQAILEAAQIAQLTQDMDQFSQGWQTLVGERGMTLSGGQKQRAAIARAVLRDPRILILDDALSAVDTYTEEEILHQLAQVRRQRTTIIVSHRISTVRDADQIIVLQNGEIAEQGNHDQLLAQQGLYYQLYQRQLIEQSLEALT